MVEPKQRRMEFLDKVLAIPDQPATVPTVQKPVNTIEVLADETEPSTDFPVVTEPTEHPPHLMGDGEGGVPDVRDLPERFQKPISPPSRA